MSIAALIIAKDEERNIEACLESVQWADERIVVDAESRDRTVEIAKQHAAQVHVRPWPGYGPQKNFGMEQARAEWILIVDADERVPGPLREEITRTIEGGSNDFVGFEIPRRNFFYGRWIRGGGIYPDFQIRLFRRSAGRYDDTLVHERLNLRGPIGTLTSPLDHYSMPTVGHHFQKIIRYTTLAAQEKLKQVSHVTAADIGLHHLGTILKTYLFRRGYRDGVHGAIVALFAGMYTFVKYAKAWEVLLVKAGTEQFRAVDQ